jgi:2-phospho-L-lactate guanylyltransferase
VRTQSISNTIWAVVPLKSPDAAKSRLQAGLDADTRRRLFFWMARQVIRTLARTPGIAGVSVVTASPEVGAFAERGGAALIWEEREAGMAEACRSAVAHLSTRVDGVLMISGDIPLISTESVAALLSCAHRGHPSSSSFHHPATFGDTPPPAGGQKDFFSPPFQGGVARSDGVVIAPDRRRSGTNALLCAPPAIVPPSFGKDSFQRHLAAARSQGLDVRIVESDVLALDIDELEDLDELQRRIEADPTLLSAELREMLPRRAEAPAQ